MLTQVVPTVSEVQDALIHLPQPLRSSEPLTHGEDAEPAAGATSTRRRGACCGCCCIRAVAYPSGRYVAAAGDTSRRRGKEEEAEEEEVEARCGYAGDGEQVTIMLDLVRMSYLIFWRPSQSRSLR